MEIIGVMGLLRSGKDTTANILKLYGFERMAFADTMREALYTLNPIIKTEQSLYGHLQEVVDRFGWDGIKKTYWNDEVRRLMQRFGTEVGRNMFGENIWVDSTFRKMNDNGKYVISDVRFPNECEAILARGGPIIKITRPGLDSPHQHISENALADFEPTYEIPNDGTIDDLKAKVARVLYDWRNIY